MIEKMMGELPVNVKFVVEGEEESGSLNLPHFAAEHMDFLKADGCVWEGVGAMEGSPGAVLCGMRGDAYYELRAAGPPNFPKMDAHSGEAGGIPNPAWRLVWALSTLKDENEEITIDGFNELVREPSKEDTDALSEDKGDEASRIMKEYGLSRTLLGRTSDELRIQHHLRPQLTICQLQSGQLGESDITIVPSSATAKLDIRLVPDLSVEIVNDLLRKHLQTRGFDDIEVITKPGYDPAKTPLSDPFVKLMRSVLTEACAPAPAVLVPMMGASGPAYLFIEHSPICMCYTDADLEGVNTHAPDENIRADTLGPSIALVAAIAERLGGA
jgi:acetylornithine deacetylase/succinyl-diaminopimelate desuccinylase-like protein